MVKIKPTPSLLRQACPAIRSLPYPSHTAASSRSHFQNIVSPKLCGELRPYYSVSLFSLITLLLDNILTRLRPSLPAEDTCDLIDVNPGLGLWSQKLHDILKPRRHILVLPNLKASSPHLSTLLDAPNSKYRHATVLDDVFDPAKGLLSHYPPSSSTTPNRTQLNPNVLMTVNLSGPKISHHGYMGTVSKLFINNLWHSHWGQRGDLYRHGMFRTLAWIPHEDKFVIVPRSVALRRRQSILLEATTAVHELAAPSRLDRKHVGQGQRFADIDLEDHQRVKASEEGSGVSTPLSRQQPLPPPSLNAVSPIKAIRQKAAFVSDAKWLPELRELDSYARARYPQTYKQAIARLEAQAKPPEPDVTKKPKVYSGVKAKDAFLLEHPKGRDWRRLLARIYTEHKTRLRAIDLVNQQRLLEREWKDAILTNSLDALSEKDLQERADLLGSKLNKLAKNNKVFAEKAIDDYRAYDHQPRVLAWNNRVAEPLLVHKHEFSPSTNQMALFDLVPTADLNHRLDTEEKLICFGHLMSFVSIYSSKSVYEVCSMIISGDVENFLQTIQDIHDPTKGGWYDLKMLRIRSLPTNLFVEIAVAFEQWPFRPSTQTLMRVDS
ncbi:hypothetical protein LTR84_007736 [Exophiala bonariae]|uniref:rRNA adenine N(6)-methyltransferase n=1 Tax=Exophiala bonariae TaxID=1690606 RepID=A0AAV9NL11_9EURO|nr:hypothetical protein LTR84_007736 [Exophiala bonariae]